MRRLVLFAALAAAACDQPPVKEIAAADQQVERARAAGAERYAPERWKQAQDALMLARQRQKARDYQGALSATNDAGENARLAIEAVGPAKEAERGSVEAALGEVRATLDRAAVERSAAARAGVPKATLLRIDAEVQRAEQALAAATRQVQAGDVKDVIPAVDALRAEALLYRAARTQWETKQTRRSRRGVSGRPR